MEQKKTKEMTDLELATFLAQETVNLSKVNQQAQMHFNNINNLQQEIHLRNQPKPKDKKSEKN